MYTADSPSAFLITHTYTHTHTLTHTCTHIYKVHTALKSVELITLMAVAFHDQIIYFMIHAPKPAAVCFLEMLFTAVTASVDFSKH